MLLRTVVVAVLAGVLFAFALPPYDVSLFGVAALALMLCAAVWLQKRPLHAAGIGLLTSVVCGLTQLGLPLDARQSGTMYGYGLAPFLFLSVVFVVVSTLAAWGSPRLREPWQWTLFVACAAVCAEFAMVWTPLPVTVALTIHKGVPFLQPLVSTCGLWGVSFLLWGWAASFVALFTVPDGASQNAANRVFNNVLILVVSQFGFGLLAYGLEQKPHGPATQPRLRVAAIQDFAPTGDGTYNGDPATVRADLTKAAKQKGAELVVWSETSEGYTFAPDEAESPASNIARQNGVLLVVGYLQSRPPKTGHRDLNRAALLSRTGKTLGVHTKNALFLGERATVTAGTGVTVVSTTKAKIGLLICFDTCYPHLPREAVAQGAQILAVPNHDPAVSRHVLHNLHAALMPFRAAENGVALVRADDTGLSHIITPDGWVLRQAGQNRAEAVVADVPLGIGKGTIYTRFGDWFVVLCFTGFVCMTLRAFVLERSRTASVGVPHVKTVE